MVTVSGRRAMTLACAGAFMVVMDATIVSVALPQIGGTLGFSADTLPWVVNAYTLTFAGFLLLGGRLCDVFGRRTMYVLGAGLFTVARTVAGLAISPETLLAARAIQGCGGALLMPVSLSLLTTTFEEGPVRARMLGAWSAVGAVGASLGPVIGGPLTQLAGWRWVFFVTVPLGIAAMALALVALPKSATGCLRTVDFTGAALVTTALSLLVYAVMESSSAGWTAPRVAGALLAGAVLGIVFLAQQRFLAQHPILPLGIFRLRQVSGGNLVLLLLGLGFFASPVLLSLYQQQVLGYSALWAGIGYLPVGAAMFVGAQVAGPLTNRIGARSAAVLLCLVGAAGFLAVALLIGMTDDYAITLLGPGLLLGFGSAAAFTPITVAATSGIPSQQSGLAAGVLNTVRQTSGAIGLAAATTIASAATTNWAHSHPGHPAAAIGHGQAVAFAVAAGCLVLASIGAAVTMPRARTTRQLADGGTLTSARNAGQRSRSSPCRQVSK